MVLYAYGLNIDELTGPMMWMAAVAVAGLLVDAWGRRKGEPEAPRQPDLHQQVEVMMRHKPRVFGRKDTASGPKRI